MGHHRYTHYILVYILELDVFQIVFGTVFIAFPELSRSAAIPFSKGCIIQLDVGKAALIGDFRYTVIGSQQKPFRFVRFDICHNFYEAQSALYYNFGYIRIRKMK